MKENKKINILSLSWRDIRSPKAGGAEVHTHEMLKRLDKNKYHVVHISMANKERPEKENIDGVNYIRKGNPLTVIIDAFFFYRKNRHKIDYVIDQCNTHRFFTSFWVPKKKRIFYIHQLTREIWDINMPFPLNIIGKVSENLMLKLNKHDRTITVSHDTEKELRELGFDNDIKIIHNGVSFEPWKEEQWLKKGNAPVFIYVGRYSPYKGINVAVEAVAKLKKQYPDAKLWILGKKNEEFIDTYLKPICKKYDISIGDAIAEDVLKENGEMDTADIVSLGFVSEEDKLKLLSKAHALVFPSIREGWGIPVTEAGCVGTPTIVYKSPGIHEAVDYGNAGYVCSKNDVDGLLIQMKRVAENKEEYEILRHKAYDFSSQFLWDKVGEELNHFLR